jgi:protein phosphatase
MTQIDPKSIETASLTDVGRRRASNQDAFGGLVPASGARLLIVADGMGGHAGGATASRVAVETVEEVVARSTDAPETTLRAALEAANRRVHEEAQNDASLAGMGTTGVALLFQPDGSAWVAHVGDSRAYRLRDGRLEQLTPDHSLVAELERRGMITAEEAQVHPRRNEVLRSIGVEPEVDVDVVRVDARPGDQYLLCSDGLSGVVGDEEIAAELLRAPPEVAVRRLVDAANERGGPDNITVQVARIPDAGARSRHEESARDKLQREERRARQRRVHRLLIAVVVVAVLLVLTLIWGLVRLYGDDATTRAGTTSRLGAPPPQADQVLPPGDIRITELHPVSQHPGQS